jgi:hypothetical protein
MIYAQSETNAQRHTVAANACFHEYYEFPSRPSQEEHMSQTATESTPSDLDAQQLTAADRCDLCGAQAYIRVQMNSGELLFCAHHGKKYQEKLTQVATDWHDESARLFNEQRA